MKTSAKIFNLIGVFVLMMSVIYTIATMNSAKGVEPAGVTTLFLTAGLCFMVGFFFKITDSKVDAGPEDDLDGEISDIEGDFGFYAPHSWWPLVLGFGCAVTMFAVSIGWWAVIWTIPLLLIGVVGWTFEFFRGEKSV